MKVAAIGFILGLTTLARAEDKPKYIWIEGESAIKHNLADNPWMKGDNAKLLSGGDALGCLNDAKDLPKPAFVLWKFAVPKDGEYQVYFRHGYKDNMGEMRYRFLKLDANGKVAKKPDAEEGWVKFDMDAAVMDRKTIGQFRTIEWTRQEPVKLQAGNYYLDLQVLGPNRAQAEAANAPVWMLMDVICLTPEPFTPNGANKPGEAPAKGSDGKGGGGSDYLN